MSKSCCVIVDSRSYRVLKSERESSLLSAFLYHLTFACDVKTYYFAFDDGDSLEVEKMLGEIRAYAPDLRRVLVYPEGLLVRMPFRYLDYRVFDERQEMERAVFSEEERRLRALIDRGDFCVILAGGSPLARCLALYGRSQGKVVIEWAQISEPTALFALF